MSTHSEKRVLESELEDDHADQNMALSAVRAAKARSPDDYNIGWICALPLEMAAAKAVLDEIHENLNVRPHDSNSYTLGSICKHCVVIGCLPMGVYGTTSATSVATQMRSSFNSIHTFLMVGVGGGAPTEKHDIRLGDVVVGTPNSECGTAVIQYDYGKTLADGYFHRMGQLNKPPTSLLTLVSRLRADHYLKASQVPAIIAQAHSKHPFVKRDFAYPGRQWDVLFRPGCEHVEEGQTCDICGSPQTINRPLRSDDDPRIHYGPIASGNQVMKHGRTRERLAQQLGILCFEMEAAGLMDNFPCLVVRGVCDYSDAHKNKHFQHYAALTAAAYATELLSIMPPRHSTNPKQSEMILDSTRAIRQMQSSMEANIQTIIKKESLGAKAEIALLQQTLLKLLKGGQRSGAIDALDDSRLGPWENNEVTNEVGRRLAMAPHRLRETCDKLILLEKPNQREKYRDLEFDPGFSRGVVLRRSSIRRFGIFGVVYNSVKTRQSHARKKRFSQRNWKGSFFIRLLPILRKTVEFTFTANFGAGGNSIAASLRYYGVIKRSTSPIFRLIDTLPSRCARRRVYLEQEEELFRSIHRSQPLLIDGTDYKRFVVDWDLDLLRTEVLKLC